MNKKLSLDYLRSYRKVLEDYIKELSTFIKKEEDLYNDFLKKVERNKLPELRLLRFDKEKNKVLQAIGEMEVIKTNINSNIDQLDKLIKRLEFNGYDHESAKKRISDLHEYILDKLEYLVNEFIED